jgi:ecotin
MSKISFLILPLLFFFFVFAAAGSRAADDMKAFPPAETGMVRHMLRLPAAADESLCQVELILGKAVATDCRNRYFFTGRIEAQTLPGWGFTRYVLDDLGVMAGTMMAVDPKAPKEMRFIRLGGEPYLIRYNSRLPVVVYAPDGVTVRYRIWRAEDEIKAMAEG